MKLGEATVLVVDDEEFLRECYANWLKRRGCMRVFIAGNGVDALRLIEKEKIDVLVSDINMPLMDGIQLIRMIRERGTIIPSIIFVSGYLEVDRAEMFELGVECMLAKPFPAKVLLDEVETSLADRRDLWLTPMVQSPKREVRIEKVSPGAHAEAGIIRFGRGGFCAMLPEPEVEGPVGFTITLEEELKELRGQGQLLWYTAATRVGAVQFGYVAPESREKLLGLVAAGGRSPLEGA